MHYTTIDGRQVLDDRAGLWRVNAGAQRNFEAVARQLDTLDYSPAFPNSTGSKNYNPGERQIGDGERDGEALSGARRFNTRELMEKNSSAEQSDGWGAGIRRFVVSKICLFRDRLRHPPFAISQRAAAMIERQDPPRRSDPPNDASENFHRALPCADGCRLQHPAREQSATHCDRTTADFRRGGPRRRPVEHRSSRTQ
jgi:hypothetical protein